MNTNTPTGTTGNPIPIQPLFSRIVFSVAVVFILAICFFKVVDLDFWWHIKAGEIILHHGIIHTDTFSYPRFGQPYLETYEWLSQVLLYLVHHFAGVNGIIVFRGCMVTLTFFILAMIDRKNMLFGAVAVILAANAGRTFFLERPQLFTYLCFALFLFAAYRYKESRKQIYLWLLVPLQVFWTNAHGAACLFGAMILFFLFMEELVSIGMLTGWRFSGTDHASLKTIGWCGLALTAASFVSPNTYHSLGYMKSLFEPRMYNLIIEWHPVGIKELMLLTGLLLSYTLAGIILSKKKDIFSLLLLAATAYLAFKSYRHIAFFIFTLTGTAIFHFKHAPWRPAFDNKAFTRWQLTAAISFIVFALLGVYTYDYRITENFATNTFGFGSIPYAEGAYNFIERNDLQGNMFNTYDSGNYLIYRGYPRRKVFIDGRANYGYDFFQKAFDAARDPRLLQELDDTYHFSYAVIDSGIMCLPQDIPYCGLLSKDPDWALVYLDEWCSVYVKKNEQNRAVIERYAYHYVRPEDAVYYNNISSVPAEHRGDLETELKRMAAENPPGTRAKLLLARLYLTQQRLPEAMDMIESVITAQKFLYEAYEIAAGIYLAEADYASAGRYYEKSLARGKHSFKRFNYDLLADVFQKAGDRSKMMKYMKMARRQEKEMSVPQPAPVTQEPSGSTNAIAYYRLGLEQERAGQIDDAIKNQTKAVSLKPDLDDAYYSLGILYHAKREQAKAIEYFQKTVAVNPRHADAYNNLGFCYQEQGLLDAAQENYEKAVAIKPESPQMHFNLATVYHAEKKFDAALREARSAKALGYTSQTLTELLKELQNR
jgi:tetratricopeptide (TPR) repeat protein